MKYYFGGREGLIDALVNRLLLPVEPEREALLAASDTVLGDVRAFVLPSLTAFNSAPTPSWRARFANVALNTPSVIERARALSDEAPMARAIFHSLATRLDHLDPDVVRNRAALMTHVVFAACAEIETRSEADATRAEDTWAQAGDFLCDALAGMLQAPISAPRP